MNKELVELDTLFRSKKFDEVVSQSKKLIQTGNFTPFIFNLRGISLENLGKNEKAFKNFEDAIKKNSKEVSYYSNAARILIKIGRINKAENYLNSALKIKKDHIFSLFEFGKLKRIQKKFDQALKYFKKVYELDPKFPDALFNIGKSYIELFQETGNTKYEELSKKNLLECSRLFPDIIDADFLLSEIYNYMNEKKHQKIMLDKLVNINFTNYRKKSALLFAIAKSYEDQKKYDQASEFLINANNEMNKHTKKQIVSKYTDRLDNLKLIFDKIINISNLEDKRLYQRKIIFIVGLPRSGTTLLHQLIASAPDIEGVGESSVVPYFFEKMIFSKDFLDNLYKNNKFNKDYLIEISNLLGNKFDKIMQQDKKIIVDKNPSNFYWIGFLKLLFPNSKVIHIKRDLKDISLSVYKNIFGVNEMDWSYSPENITNYIKIYLKTINYWKKKYPNFLYEIEYENLINNKNEETKKLFSFCNIDWSEDIFNFYKTGKTIRTASIYQVKKPIYNSSVNISEKYSPYLPFLNEIDDLN